jgi:hypothetical protein
MTLVIRKMMGNKRSHAVDKNAGAHLTWVKGEPAAGNRRAGKI